MARWRSLSGLRSTEPALDGKAQTLKCRERERQFSVKLGTVMEDSPVSLTKWLPALWLISNCKNGVSSWELHRALGATQKTAWFMLHRLRLMLSGNKFGHSKIGGPDSTCEADETFIGGKIGNMHKSKRAEWAGSGGARRNKTVVIGVLDRTNNKVRPRLSRLPDATTCRRWFATRQVRLNHLHR